MKNIRVSTEIANFQQVIEKVYDNVISSTPCHFKLVDFWFSGDRHLLRMNITWINCI